MQIRTELTSTPKTKPDEKHLGFGNHYTDHMFIMDYEKGQGWHDARIVPYQPIILDPSALVFHYAQECFEGLKAYRCPDGSVQLFRPDKNAERMQSTHRRLCIPEIPVEDFVEAVKALVSVDKDWVPSEPETSLYIRPFTIATEPVLGVKASDKYQFIIICSPSGAYYEEGMNPVKIYVEDEFVRAAPGGTGYIKCGGNYAASIIAGEKAHKMGYSQVLWLDGVERKYVEEVGSMNIMFKIGGEIYTAATVGTVLPGITRMSCLELLKEWGYTVHEGKLAITDVMQAGRDGSLEEVFGTGTAAVISPVGGLMYENETVEINGFETGELTQRLYDTLTGIQFGTLDDTMGWTVKVD
ncbi:MAG: branched-chain amino acid aminotransferase [Oscillospiraceae bacterium]|nr:branched-chain amino acid aminotransferase [Oscillospiraceae bacterium]